jgi:hypothetical protein
MSKTMDDDTWQSQYGGYSPGEVTDSQSCMHRFVTGVDGSRYCQKCGAMLKGRAGDAYGTRGSQAAGSARRSMLIGIVVVVAIVAAVAVGIVGWKYFTRTPAPVASPEQARPFDLSAEPAQATYAKARLHAQPDGTAIYTLANYKIDARVIGVRAWAPYDHASSGFPIDLALTWGDVAKSDYHKYVDFHFTSDYSANQWLMYQFRWGVSPPWTQAYFECHVSNNHVCPASQNLYNAIKSLKEGDEVLMEGYLAASARADGTPLVSSSLRRNDTDAGACEAFYVEKMQVGSKVYK